MFDPKKMFEDRTPPSPKDVVYTKKSRLSAATRARNRAIDIWRAKKAEPVFVVTRRWIHQHGSSAKGYVGWTKPQLRVLDVGWPPRKGWVKNIVGRSISMTAKKKFEELGTQQAARRGTRITTTECNHGSEQASQPAEETGR
jgi:hypothetical protein